MPSELSEWPNESQAAGMLRTSTKTILRYARAGKIEMQKRERSGLKPENVFNPTDLQRLQPQAHVMPSSPENLDHWPTIEQAAEDLDASVRTIWRHHERGTLEIKKRPVPGRKPINVCNPSHVKKLKPPLYIVKDDSGGAAGREVLLPVSKVAEAIERIVAVFQDRKDAVAMSAFRPWITLDEAAEFSGLTETYIRDRARVGLIDSVRGGPHGALRIRRASLEAFAGVATRTILSDPLRTND